MLKRVVNKVGRMSPDFVSHWFVKIPFKFRHGSVYSRFEKKIKESRSWTEKELENYVITNFAKIFEHAKNFNMYREKYKKAGVFDLVIKSIEDIRKVPILTRSEIRAHITEFQGDYFTQTSGTSGNPLAVYLDKEVWAREWPHYHYIWAKADYHYEDTKFMIKRQHLKDKFINYSFEHNEFIVNTYKMTETNIDEFFKVLIEHDVKYFHGYPSSIVDFLKEIDKKISKEKRLLLKDQIKCCFFCSEMPLPNKVKYIRNKWEFDFIASYGHTEACVLGGAPKNQLNYEAFHTYGYVEAENNMLLGTSYHNTDMPLIRYNTDDIIRAKRYQNGIVKSFEVTEGRVFDYIIDKHGLKIAYVGLFLEREHAIWDHIDYFQLFQEQQGTATILISHSKDEVLDIPSLMNLENFDIDFDYLFLKEPIRTTSGKVPLRVHKLPV